MDNAQLLRGEFDVSSTRRIHDSGSCRKALDYPCIYLQAMEMTFWLGKMAVQDVVSQSVENRDRVLAATHVMLHRDHCHASSDT